MAWSNPKITLFHGTDDSSASSILAGIDPKWFRPGRDFGVGFYTTTNLSQALKWAASRAQLRKGKRSVVAYEIERDVLAQLEVVWFVRGDSKHGDFWDLIRACRDGLAHHERKGPNTSYDVAVGPVAIAWTKPPFKTAKNYDQISFHTTRAIGLLANGQLVHSDK